jgi:cobalt/nickel transport system permease protein
MLVMFAVVLIQALLFQDGGIAALGANTLNLAVLGVGTGWILFRWAYALAGAGRRRLLVAAAFAAYGSTVLVGAAVAVELAWSGLVPVGPALMVVGGGHAIVGLAEAGLTLAILALVARSRPELLAPAAPQQARGRTVAWIAAAAAMALATAAVYFGSVRPDALEAATARLGLGAGRTAFRAPLADYAAPIGGPWVAAALGLVIVFGLVWAAVTVLLIRRRP